MSWGSFAFLAFSKVASAPRFSPGITVTPEGFVYHPAGSDATTMRWEEVRRVNGYGVALYSHESLCLDFDSVHGTRLSVNEEAPGFPALAAALTQALGISQEALASPTASGEVKVLFER